jgi:hypothetical protein
MFTTPCFTQFTLQYNRTIVVDENNKPLTFKTLQKANEYRNYLIEEHMDNECYVDINWNNLIIVVKE